MKKLIAIAVAAAVMLSLSGCMARGMFFKNSVLNAFETAVSALGRLSLTSELFIRGDLSRSLDGYTGTYKIRAFKEHGKDVVFGGTSTKPRKIRLAVSVTNQSGEVEIKVRLGSKTKSYPFGESGFLELDLDIDGGSCYISAEYSGFSGSVVMTSEEG